MEPEHGSGSSKHLTIEPTENEDDIPTPGRKSALSSSSSSSSGSSLIDFAPLDLSELTEGTSSPPNFDEDVQLAPEDDENGVPSKSSHKSGESDQESPGSVFSPDVFDLSPELNLYNGSAMQSPTTQVMERSEESTPYRIPSSVFARNKSSTPLDWSVASNESLFSIHVGNSSFFKDNFFLTGRSGELTKSEELTSSSCSPASPSVAEEIEENTTDPGEGLDVTEVAAETMKSVLSLNTEDSSKENTSPPREVPKSSSSVSQHSDGSVTSTQSFAFPILTKEGGKSGSEKAEPEQEPQQQPSTETPGEASNVPQARWFPCFASVPFCC